MDELSAMRVFAQVVEEGSFSAVSRKTELSVSSISRIINALETDLGVRLLNRSTRSIRLTEAGELYFRGVLRILDDVGSTRRIVSSYQDEVKGNLKVHARTSPGAQVIAPALKRFLDKYPDLKIDVTLTDDRADLVAEGIDVAVWFGHLADSNLVARRLSAGRRMVCASPAYFERFGIPKRPADLELHNCMVYSPRNQPQEFNEWRFERSGKIEIVRAKGNLQTSSTAVLLSCALAGLGLIIAQKWTVGPSLRSGTLIQVFDDYDIRQPDYDTAIYAVYPHSQGLPPKVRVFVDFLVELFSKEDEFD